MATIAEIDALRVRRYSDNVVARHDIWVGMYLECRGNIRRYGVNAALPIPHNRRLFAQQLSEVSVRLCYNYERHNLAFKRYTPCPHSS